MAEDTNERQMRYPIRAISLLSVLALIVGAGLLLTDMRSVAAMRVNSITGVVIGMVVLMLNTASWFRSHGATATFALTVASLGLCEVILAVWALC